MIERSLAGLLLQSLAEVPAVCLLGPRQVGKTTLAREAKQKLNAVYLDLESEQDLAKLTETEAYLTAATSPIPAPSGIRWAQTPRRCPCPNLLARSNFARASARSVETQRAQRRH